MEAEEDAHAFRQIRTLQMTLQAHHIDMLQDCMRTLTGAAKGVLDSCLYDDEDAGADGSGSGGGSGSGAAAAGGAGESAEAAAVRAEARELMAKIHKQFNTTTDVATEAMLRKSVLQDLQRQGLAFYARLDDGSAEGLGFQDAVAAGHSFHPVNDAAKFVAEHDASRAGEGATLRSQQPLKGLIASYLTEVKQMEVEVDDDEELVVVSSDKGFNCPLSLKPFEEPVITPCGHTFEAENLRALLRRDKQCPMAGCGRRVTWSQCKPDVDMMTAMRRAKRR